MSHLMPVTAAERRRRAGALRRAADRAREWADEAEALPEYPRSVLLRRRAAGQRQAADAFDREADDLTKGTR